METKHLTSEFIKWNSNKMPKLMIVATLWEYWEEDRCSEGEYVYDTTDREDFSSLVEIYGVENAIEMHNLGRFWLAGWQMSYKGCNIDASHGTAQLITENSLEVLYGIEERYEACKDQGISTEAISANYGNFIDFEAWENANTRIEKYGFEWERGKGMFTPNEPNTFNQYYPDKNEDWLIAKLDGEEIWCNNFNGYLVILNVSDGAYYYRYI